MLCLLRAVECVGLWSHMCARAKTRRILLTGYWIAMLLPIPCDERLPVWAVTDGVMLIRPQTCHQDLHAIAHATAHSSRRYFRHHHVCTRGTTHGVTIPPSNVRVLSYSGATMLVDGSTTAARCFATAAMRITAKALIVYATSPVPSSPQ